MPTTPLERLLFLQGNQCFFCNRPIPRDQASIEHLVPQSLQGTNNMNNLVACCKTLNGIFGNLSLKEKLRVILMQQGEFVCPNAPKEQQPQHAPQLSQKGHGQPQKALPAPKHTPPQERKNAQPPQERPPEKKTQYPPYPGPNQPEAETPAPQPLPEPVKEMVAEAPPAETAPKAASEPAAKPPAQPAPKASSQGAGRKAAKTPRSPSLASAKPAAAKAAAAPAALPAPEIKPEGNAVPDDPDQWKLFEMA